MNVQAPPNSKEAEIALLGALMRSPQKLEGVSLKAEDFYYQAHQDIFEAIITVAAKKLPIDFVIIGEELESEGKIDDIGGLPYLTDILQNTFASNAIAYAEIIRDAAKARCVLRIAETMRDVNAGNWKEVSERTVKDIMKIEEEGGGSYQYTMKEAMTGAVNGLQQAFEHGGLVGVSTGLAVVDKAIGGFHSSDLITVGGRPAMGKTSMLIHFAISAKVPVGFISAEQPHDQVATRIIASHGGVNTARLRNASMDEAEWGRVTRAVDELQEMPVFINDKAGISLVEISRQARRWKRENGIRALYIDYLQRIKPVDKRLPKHEQVGDIAMGLKELARELQIPVIVLAQVNRTVEQRPDKRPRMGDLKHSGEIEQESDQVIMLYRDEVYNPDTPDAGIVELLVDKNRHGPTGRLKAAWLGEYMRFENLAYPDDSYSKQQNPY